LIIEKREYIGIISKKKFQFFYKYYKLSPQFIKFIKEKKDLNWTLPSLYLIINIEINILKSLNIHKYKN